MSRGATAAPGAVFRKIKAPHPAGWTYPTLVSGEFEATPEDERGRYPENATRAQIQSYLRDQGEVAPVGPVCLTALAYYDAKSEHLGQVPVVGSSTAAVAAAEAEARSPVPAWMTASDEEDMDSFEGSAESSSRSVGGAVQRFVRGRMNRLLPVLQRGRGGGGGGRRPWEEKGGGGRSGEANRPGPSQPVRVRRRRGRRGRRGGGERPRGQGTSSSSTGEEAGRQKGAGPPVGSGAQIGGCQVSGRQVRGPEGMSIASRTR